MTTFANLSTIDPGPPVILLAVLYAAHAVARLIRECRSPATAA